jgi:hypothetical protein
MSTVRRAQVTGVALTVVCAIGPTPPIEAQAILSAVTMGAALSLAPNKAVDLNQTDVQSSFLKVHATGSSVQILTLSASSFARNIVWPNTGGPHHESP